MNDDTEAWLAVLRGEPKPGAHPEAEREAELLRDAILARQASTAGVESRPLPDKAAFMARLQAGPAVAAATPEPTARLPIAGSRRRRRWLGAVAASAVLVSSALLVNGLLPKQPVQGYRGLVATPRLLVVDPAATAALLAQQLRALGAEVGTAEQAGDYQVEMRLPAALPASQRLKIAELLDDYELSLPADGHLELVVSPR